jgi:hypothetical protein
MKVKILKEPVVKRATEQLQLNVSFAVTFGTAVAGGFV